MRRTGKGEGCKLLFAARQGNRLQQEHQRQGARRAAQNSPTQQGKPGSGSKPGGLQWDSGDQTQAWCKTGKKGPLTPHVFEGPGRQGRKLRFTCHILLFRLHPSACEALWDEN